MFDSWETPKARLEASETWRLLTIKVTANKRGGKFEYRLHKHLRTSSASCEGQLRFADHS